MCDFVIFDNEHLTRGKKWWNDSLKFQKAPTLCLGGIAGMRSPFTLSTAAVDLKYF